MTKKFTLELALSIDPSRHEIIQKATEAIQHRLCFQFIG
jgi:hypothetical protein